MKEYLLGGSDISKVRWSEVLDVFYEEEVRSEGEPWHEENVPDEVLEKFPKRDEKDVRRAILYLYQLELIDKIDLDKKKNYPEGVGDEGDVPLIEPGTYSLTERGLEVAHDREMKRASRKTNAIIAVFTAVLAAVAISRFIIQTSEIPLQAGFVLGVTFAAVGGSIYKLLERN